MNLQAIYHNAKSNYAYAYKEDELHVRIRTAKNDCTAIYLWISQKHLWDKKQKFQMEKILSDHLFDYYQYNFKTDDTRLGYYFEIRDVNETVIYTESGFSKDFDDKYSYFHYFQYPYINKIDVHEIPNWVHDAVFYQIFVERFNNGDKKNDPENLTPWNELPNPKSFYGGDLKGIIDKLDFISELGINGIYLTPIFQSPSNHKYDTTDYRIIDKAFGDKETLCELVEKAHERGIKIILDGVFNHCGYEFEYFQDVVKNGKDSEYCDWFHIKSFPITKNPLNYCTFMNVAEMPKLNTSNPSAKKYFLDTVEYWTRETKIDGWRLDVSDEIDFHFWTDFRKVVKSINSEAVIIGENWHNSYPWLTGTQFDSVMNYPVTKSCIQFFATKEISASRFGEDLSGYLIWDSTQVNFAMLNLLDSHDTMRFLTWCKGDKRIFKLSVIFLFSYIGIPCTYYGSEIGMEGNGDPDCRRTFNWNPESWDMDMLNFYKNIIKIRKNNKPFGYGNIKLYAENDVLFIERTFEGEKIVTIINNTRTEKSVKLPYGVKPLLNATLVESNETVILKKYSGEILKIIDN